MSEKPWVGNATVTEDVIEQLAVVRDGGGANMYSRSQVYAMAVENECQQLRDFCAQIELLPRNEQGRKWGEALERLGEYIERRHETA